ncbi:MAG: metalloregulator ArsR/SmtB family transcription factor [Acidobacteria bacterium]|nr:metalloregulator ArsR/SmtB family transcription factor [Acidobacteriota bacterium]
MELTRDSNLDSVFRALGHPTRRALLETLAAGPETVVNLAEPHDLSLNAVSKHLKTLEAAGLVSRQRDRTFHQITLRPEALRPALRWIEHYAAFWSDNLASLKRTLEES